MTLQDLLDAISLKFVDSAVSADVGGRVYYRKAPVNEYPRLVYSFVSTAPDNVFAKKGESALMQFDLFFPDSLGEAVLTTAYQDLRTLLDDCQLTVTGYGLVEFTWQNTVTLSEDVELPDGSDSLTHMAIDYQLDTQEA